MIIYLDMISHVAPVPEVDFHHVYLKVLEVPKVAFLGKSNYATMVSLLIVNLS